MKANTNHHQRKKLKLRYELKKLRLLYFIIFGTLSVFLILFLNNSFKHLPALGKFFNPQQGFWQNIEVVNQKNEDVLLISSRDIKNTIIKYDARNVPHIFADNELDAYFMQGYLHAKNRLFQMDFYSHLAEGRLSEMIGPQGIVIDKYMRRIYLVYSASKMANEIEKDLLTNKIIKSYTDGVNEYINSLKYAQYPLEYKLYSIKPELWSTLKTALILKLIAFDKTGFGEDFKKNIIAKKFGETVFNLLYPAISTIDVPVFNATMDFEIPDSPIIPLGKGPNPEKQIWNSTVSNITYKDPYNFNMEIGSSALAVSNKKTESGKAMLCYNNNSFFTLPNTFYELQINCPTHNVYGISYPGVPCIYAGFNDYISWGYNTPNVDVKDIYEIDFYDAHKKLFMFNNLWTVAYVQEETIKVKNGLDKKIQTINTFLGPVIFDTVINNKVKGYVMKWTGQDVSNELKAYYLINKVHKYDEFRYATKNIQSPISNIVYADNEGNISLQIQGKIPAKFKYQGDFVMSGKDSSYLWKYYIPQSEKPFLYNPSSNFVFSANQFLFYPEPVYPYYLGSRFNGISSKRIYEYMTKKDKMSLKDMIYLQSENYSSFAEILVPLLLDYIGPELVNTRGLKFIKLLQNWNFRYDPEEEAATIFEIWIENLQRIILNKNLRKTNALNTYSIPPISLIQMLQNTDTQNDLIDDNLETIGETWEKIIRESFEISISRFSALNKSRQLEWMYNRKYTLKHLLNGNSLSISDISLYGGNDKTYTNIPSNYGTNFKMIIHHTQPIQAYVNIAGGQSGNPGSPFYSSSVDKWLKGEYEKVVYFKLKSEKIGVIKNTEVRYKVKKPLLDYFNLNQ